MIAELLMRAGNWDLALRPDSSLTARRSLEFGDVIYITPTHAGVGADLATIRAQALYAGLLTERSVRSGQYGGPGLVGFFSTTKSQSSYIPNYAGLPTAPFTFAQFLAGMFPLVSNGITVGAAHNPSTTTVAEFDTTKPGLKNAIDTLADQTGNEWRITPQGALDYGQPDLAPRPPRHRDTPAFFAVRQVLVLADHNGPGDWGDWLILAPTSWAPGSDINSLRNSAVVKNKSETTVTARAANNDPVLFRRLNNSGNAVFNNDQAIVAPSDNATDIANLAQAAANLYATPSWSIACKIRGYAPTRWFIPGDTIFVFDPIEGMAGTVDVGIPGLNVTPVSIRVMGMTWPIETGMGVFVSSAADRAVITDLTPHIEWETGETTLTLGSSPPSGAEAVTRSLIE